MERPLGTQGNAGRGYKQAQPFSGGRPCGRDGSSSLGGDGTGDCAASSANSRRSWRLPKAGDPTMVAHRKGRQHQGAIDKTWKRSRSATVSVQGSVDNNALAAIRSTESKPSVNLANTGCRNARAFLARPRSAHNLARLIAVRNSQACAL